jgi:cell wall-associated NlpC family hydrolase
MRSIIRVACAASLAFLMVPQAAFGLAKPFLPPHPDAAPVDRAPVSAGVELGGTGTARPLSSLSLSSGIGSGSNSISFASLSDGDIIVVLDPMSLTGHAGLFDRSHYTGITSYAVLSANIVPVNGVQHEKCSKYRSYEWAWALRVPAEYGHRVSVRNFAGKQLGKPYSVLGAKTDLKSFYCSKLAWVAYHSVTGVDLDGDGGFWVWPADLILSRYTTIVGYWG